MKEVCHPHAGQQELLWKKRLKHSCLKAPAVHLRSDPASHLHPAPTHLPMANTLTESGSVHDIRSKLQGLSAKDAYAAALTTLCSSRLACFLRAEATEHNQVICEKLATSCHDTECTYACQH
eukprot:1157805-Pelagomonas_calceolata.AAC.2